MDKVNNLFDQAQTAMMTIGGSIIVLAIIVAGIMILASLNGDGLRKSIRMIATIGIGGVLIGGAVFFAGLFTELGKYLGGS